MKQLLLAAALSLLYLPIALSQTTRAEMTREERIQRYIELQRQLQPLFAAGKYEEALPLCREVIELAPKQPDGYYNMACCLARLGKAEEAFTALGQAADAGYAEPAHMREDEDLTALRKDKRFDEILAKSRQNEMKGPFDKGEPIKNIKTIEDFPEGGFRYRLRLAEAATPEKPHRLIIWLHPSGGSMNNVVERLTPTLASHGFALLVLTQKQFMSWREDEGDKLMNQTLAAVAKTPGLDARKPLLMGFSAGGQMALTLWAKMPDKFGGLIIDAAYPIDLERMARGQAVPMKLPESRAIKDLPIFSVVGTKDGGSVVWKQVTPMWLKAGVPLRVLYVPDQGHAWLMGKEQVAALEEWLDAVAAGKRPTDALPATTPAASQP